MGVGNVVPFRTWMRGLILAVFLDSPASGQAGTASRADPAALERSYWVHASLGLFTQRNYWGTDFPATAPPTREEVRNAARLLSGSYGANRLYLIYHQEMSIPTAREVFTWWREACPGSVELVPTLLLRMYDDKQTPVFTAAELRDLADFFQRTIHARRLGVYDVHKNREPPKEVAELGKRFPDQRIRIGLQPGEELAPSFMGGVQDTWSGFCHGKRNREDWLQPGFGAETLCRWVKARNSGAKPIAWNLITVAWDYTTTERGGFPGYDDAERNMPLPAGRNRAGVRLIVRSSDRDQLAGFSSDLYILNENSRSAAHDGRGGAFYQTLREGREYQGYYAVPFREIVEVFREMANGRWPAE